MRRALKALTTVAAVATVLAWPSDGTAAEPKRIGGSGDWNAYVVERGGARTCYMVSKPTKDEGDYTRRGDIFALVTNEPSRDIDGEVSFVAGYTYRSESEVTVQIGGTSFELFTSGDRAWTRGPEEDSVLVDAMIKGADMVVKGYSSRGTLTTDTYSLRGFTATKRSIGRACG